VRALASSSVNCFLGSTCRGAKVSSLSLPLSPSLCVLVSDRERERVSERERACFVVEFRSALLLIFGLAGDVQLWNRLQETI